MKSRLNKFSRLCQTVNFSQFWGQTAIGIWQDLFIRHGEWGGLQNIRLKLLHDP